MGLIKRVKRVFVADLHDMVDKMENPVSLVKQYLREVEEQFQKGKQSLAQQYVVEKKYNLLIAETAAVIEKRTRQARLAASKGEEEIAKLALQEKILAEKKLSSYEQQYEIIHAKTNELLEQLEDLQHKYEELKLKKNELISRMNVAKTLKNIQQNTASCNEDHAIKGFARMEEKVWHLEAETQAGNVLTCVARKPAINPLLADEVEAELQKIRNDQEQLMGQGDIS